MRVEYDANTEGGLRTRPYRRARWVVGGVAIIVLVCFLPSMHRLINRTWRTQISAAALAAKAQFDPLNHLCYRGGNNEYYFIDHHHFKTTDYYKVRRGETTIPDEYLNEILPGSVLVPPTTRPATQGADGG